MLIIGTRPVDRILTLILTIENEIRAFSAAQQIESDAIRAGILTREDLLSPMQLLQWWVTHTIELMCLYLSPHYRHRTHFQHSLSVECSTHELPTSNSGFTGDAHDHVTEVGGMMPESD